jgi:hypothetical protein
MIVHDGINPISSTVLLEPLWARSAHVMTFRAVMLDRLDHYAHHVRNHRRYSLWDRLVPHTVANTGGNGCSAQVTHRLNLAA